MSYTEQIITQHEDVPSLRIFLQKCRSLFLRIKEHEHISVAILP